MKQNRNDKQKFQMRLLVDEDNWDAFKKMCYDEGVSMSFMINRMIEEAIK